MNKDPILRYAVFLASTGIKHSELYDDLGSAVKAGMAKYGLSRFMVCQLTSSIVYDSAESAPKSDPKQVN